MMTIDPREAANALSDIDAVVRRVKQSRFYNFASLMLILWGAVVAAGYVASQLMPRSAGYAWIALYVVGIAGSFAISRFDHVREGVRTFDLRIFAALMLFLGFGLLWTTGLAHFNGRQLGTFWPTYFMMAYAITGLWFGWAFVVIGLGITALTLIGYFFLGDWFELWMAVVDGGGLMLGGFWMRRS
jgi:hypothetical protein